jgi:hypothetical protein
MRQTLCAAIGLALLLVTNLAWAGSSIASLQANTAVLDQQAQGPSQQATPPAAQPAPQQPYQHCSQANLPLFYDYPAKTDYDLNSFMHYTFYKDGNDRDLIMWGEIDQCDEPRLRKVLQIVKPVDNIILDSPGGALEEAMAMGRTLRAYGATTLIRNGNECVSACNFLFMGGTVRMVEPQADFEVHMFDSHAADLLKAETVNPPTDLASFLEMFPFRSDIDMDQVVAEVKSRNDARKTIAKELSQIDTSEEEAMAATSAKPASTVTTGSTAPTPPPLPSGDIMADINQTCELTLEEPLYTNSSLGDREKFHHQCEQVLDRGYTVEDWFKDEAITENVKAIQQDSAQVAAQIASYLSEMSISLRYLTDFASIPNSKPRQLTVDEMRNLFLVNAD